MKASKLTRETINEIGVYDRNFPDFGVGDTVAVSLRVKEAGKERIQVFEGDVIAIKQNGASTTFTIRKIGANAVSVERILPFYCPSIHSIKFVRSGKVRRAKLYYIRERIGKAARVKEEVLTKAQKEQRSAKRKSGKVSTPKQKVAKEEEIKESQEENK